jgi:hypothetical protein
MTLQLPSEVVSFLNAAAPLRTPRLRIHPLSLAECVIATTELREISVAERLGLIVLDNARDSNPYCLITCGPASGKVVHFSHDPEPRLAFSDLTSFLEALRAVVRDGDSIDSLQHDRFHPHPNQSLLCTAIREVLTNDEEYDTLELSLLFPLLDPSDHTTVYQIASNIDFLVRQIVAEFIETHPREQLRYVAEILAADSYTQVAQPAQHALYLMVHRPKHSVN